MKRKHTNSPPCFNFNNNNSNQFFICSNKLEIKPKPIYEKKNLILKSSKPKLKTNKNIFTNNNIVNIFSD